MNREIKERIIRAFPDIPFLRKLVAKRKLKSMKSRFLSAEDAALGEKDPTARKMLVERSVAKWPKYSESPIALARTMLAEAPCFEGRRDSEEAYTDMLFHWFAYGFTPDEYVFFGLEKKSLEERMGYVSDQQRVLYLCQMNDFVAKQTFTDKMRTYDYYKPYFKREAISISKESDYERFCAFVDKNPSFVKKPYNMCMGKGVGLISLDTCGKTKKQVFNELIENGKHILEQPIHQSAITARFNPSSVNSVRFFTLNTREGILCPFGFFRTGRKGSFVDNGGAGGVFSGIDMKTGTVCTDGMDERGVEYVCHPESGLVYKGFQLPDWDEAVKLCKKLAGMVSKVKYIGWDIAYTDDGWIVVEANSGGQLLMQGPMHQGARDVLEKAMEKMDLMC